MNPMATPAQSPGAAERQRSVALRNRFFFSKKPLLKYLGLTVVSDAALEVVQ